MTIPYTLDANNLTDEGGYFARVRSVGTADLEMIADRIVGRGSTVGKADVIAVLNLLEEVCIDLVLEGYRVHLGDLVQLYCSIEGVFDLANDSFDSSRHALKGTARTGSGLNDALKYRGQARKQELRRPYPTPKEFTDVSSGFRDRFTPKGMGRLTGVYLKFDPEADDEGLFLIDEAGQEHRLAVGYNTPGLLIFHLPEVPAGTYYLEVRSRMRFASDVRTSRLAQPLTAL